MACTHLYFPLERGTVRVKHLIQDHNLRDDPRQGPTQDSNLELETTGPKTKPFEHSVIMFLQPKLCMLTNRAIGILGLVPMDLHSHFLSPERQENFSGSVYNFHFHPWVRFKIYFFHLSYQSLQLPSKLSASVEENGKKIFHISEVYIPVHKHTFFYFGCTLILVNIFIEVFCYNCTKTNQVKLVVCHRNHEHTCLTIQLSHLILSLKFTIFIYSSMTSTMLILVECMIKNVYLYNTWLVSVWFLNIWLIYFDSITYIHAKISIKKIFAPHKKIWCHITSLPTHNGHLYTMATLLCPKVAIVERFDCIDNVYWKSARNMLWCNLMNNLGTFIYNLTKCTYTLFDFLDCQPEK